MPEKESLIPGPLYRWRPESREALPQNWMTRSPGWRGGPWRHAGGSPWRAMRGGAYMATDPQEPTPGTREPCLRVAQRRRWGTIQEDVERCRA
jgi:hypothetical protein